MSLFNNSIMMGASAAGAYEIERSLRFNSGDTAHLTQTPTAGDTKKWTWSSWVKKSTANGTFLMAGTNGTNDCELYITNTFFRFLNRTSGSVNTMLDTDALFRDPSAWYHFVAIWDTAQADADNRVKIYVNGTQITSFSTETRPSINTDSHINSNVAHRVGSRTDNTSYCDGYMADTY